MHTHIDVHTHTLICSPKGHLELHKLALVGWGLSAGKLVRRCISLKGWTKLTLFPNIMLLFCSPSSGPLPFSVFAALSFVSSLFLTNSPLLARLIHQICISFPFSFSLDLRLLFPSLTYSPLFLFHYWWMEWKAIPAVSLNAAAVAFLYSFIQRAVKYSSAFQLLFSLHCLCECITSTLLNAAVNEPVCLADIRNLGSVADTAVSLK